MSALESSLWRWLRDGVRDVPADVLHMTRVENASTAGMPDVEGHVRGVGQFWIELKVARRPSDPAQPVEVEHFRPKQVAWLHNRWLVGGKAWLLLRVEGADGGRVPYLVPGKSALRVKEGATERELHRMALDVQPRTPLLYIEAAVRGHTGYRGLILPN